MIEAPSLPLVSIIIPTYNRSQSFAVALQSALAQTYANCEIIVADDSSTDRTAEVVHEVKDARVRYIGQEHNIGMPANWGAGLSFAQGDYVMFLGDDDQLKPEHVQTHLSYFLAEAKGLAVVFSRYDLCDVTGKHLAIHGEPINSPVRYDDLALLQAALSIEWFIGASLYSKSALLKVWESAAHDGYVFDVGLHARMALTGAGGGLYIPEHTLINTVHEHQTSNTKKDIMFAQKSDLIRNLLQQKPNAAQVRVLKRELANWYTTHGREMARTRAVSEARHCLAEAVAADPSSLWSWKQLALAYLWPRKLL